MYEELSKWGTHLIITIVEILLYLPLFHSPWESIFFHQVHKRDRVKGLGPSTPVPFQTPVSSSSIPMTALKAVWAQRPGIESLHAFLIVSHLVQVDILFLAIFLALDPGTRAGLTFHASPKMGRIRQAGSHDIARGNFDILNFDGFLVIQTEHVQGLQNTDEFVSQPYLKVTRLHLMYRGTSRTSSCSTLTHSTLPMPPGNSNVSGSENGAVVNQFLPFSQITGGFRHSSMVVQMEKLGAKS